MGVVQMHIRIIERTPVVTSNNKEAQSLGVAVLQHFADGEKITQTFGHLLVVDVDKAIVHPIAGQRYTVGAFTLCNFIFVMGKL